MEQQYWAADGRDSCHYVAENPHGKPYRICTDHPLPDDWKAVRWEERHYSALRIFHGWEFALYRDAGKPEWPKWKPTQYTGTLGKTRHLTGPKDKRRKRLAKVEEVAKKARKAANWAASKVSSHIDQINKLAGNVRKLTVMVEKLMVANEVSGKHNRREFADVQNQLNELSTNKRALAAKLEVLERKIEGEPAHYHGKVKKGSRVLYDALNSLDRDQSVFYRGRIASVSEALREEAVRLGL